VKRRCGHDRREVRFRREIVNLKIANLLPSKTITPREKTHRQSARWFLEYAERETRIEGQPDFHR
jgi:hypothetical protein